MPSVPHWTPRTGLDQRRLDTRRSRHSYATVRSTPLEIATVQVKRAAPIHLLRLEHEGNVRPVICVVEPHRAPPISCWHSCRCRQPAHHHHLHHRLLHKELNVKPNASNLYQGYRDTFIIKGVVKRPAIRLLFLYRALG